MSEYSLFIVYCIGLIFISYLSIKIFIKLAPRLSLVDIPNKRSSHKIITPRGAGIIFGLLYILAISIYNFNELQNTYLIIISIIIVYLTGLVDDKIDIKAKTKFIFLIIASIIVYFQGLGFNSLGTYFDIDFALGFLALPFTVLVIVGLTNAINLSDGLDGLAGSLSVIILSTLLYIGIKYNDMQMIIWSGLLISVVLGFLILNWHPAKVFMGDTGSLTLGFIISLLVIKSLDYVNHVSLLFLVAVPVLDTLIVMIRRIKRGVSPFQADKNHLHHIINNLKQDKAYTVKMLLMIQFVFCCMFIQIHNKDNLLNLVIFIFLFMIFYGLFDPKMRRRKKKIKQEKKI